MIVMTSEVKLTREEKIKNNIILFGLCFRFRLSFFLNYTSNFIEVEIVHL